MITIRQIEREWNSRQYQRLFRELTAARPEASFSFDFESCRSIPAAAMSVIRLDELNQAHVPLYARLVRAILAGQDQSDGGWGDPVTTALCLRALFTGKGTGVAVDRGLTYLANLQKSEGIWPSVPIRRLPADPYVSAIVLYELGDNARFRAALKFDDAVQWFVRNEPNLSAREAQLWERASVRCRFHVASPMHAGSLWTAMGEGAIPMTAA